MNIIDNRLKLNDITEEDKEKTKQDKYRICETKETVTIFFSYPRNFSRYNMGYRRHCYYCVC